ncbi:MAG: LemA family protein [Deltaproteobacteria bacterium]|jgi:LemA protein|nr:LemA family protein [Syntrophaceae bacterium]
MIPLIVLVIILAVIAFYFVGIYNSLVSLRNLYQNAYTQIDIQLKRRYDLIPNLVEAAKGYLAHERATLEAVIKARNTAVDASKAAAAAPGSAAAMAGLAQAEGSLAGVLSKLVAVVESYPDLKADATIRDLMEELTSTENKISFARQAYNDAVTVYNTRREQFPDNIVSSTFDFKTAALLEAVEKAEERQAPKVSFS